MEEAGEDEPAGMAIGSDRFRRLHEMFDLGAVGVGVAVVDERVEKLHRFPNALLPHLQGAVLSLFGKHELMGLVRVVKAVELSNRRSDLSRVVPEGVTLLGIAFE